MIRISSNATLFLKIFLPTFWMVFFGIFTIAILFVDTPLFGSIPALYFKSGLLAFFVAGTAILYFSIIQLKRVELDELYVYVSNYYNTLRYPFHNIEKITERDIGLFYLIKIHLKAPGKFGKKITFLLDTDMWKDLTERYPEIARQMQGIRIDEEK